MMNCKKCGKTLTEGEKFCGNCGMQVENDMNYIKSIDHNENHTNDINVNETINQNSMQTGINYEQQEQPKQKKNIIIIIVIVIACVLVGIVALFVGIFAIATSGSEKLVCDSKEGKITIMYNDKTITGYTANGITYDLDVQKRTAELIGTDTYVKEFAVWFENNTSGSCTVDGKEVLK